MKSFADVIALWPSAEALAADLSLRGVTVRQWRNRNSIPAAYWGEIVAAAEARGATGLSLDVLAKIAAAAKAGQVPSASEAA